MINRVANGLIDLFLISFTANLMFIAGLLLLL